MSNSPLNGVKTVNNRGGPTHGQGKDPISLTPIQIRKPWSALATLDDDIFSKSIEGNLDQTSMMMVKDSARAAAEMATATAFAFPSLWLAQFQEAGDAKTH
ncbi:hypothetical protein NE237_026822 [Protea cynaroides]|uniref:Uncharacterized protein n=1 Tax=Protea cynaroides TaxID=273540 RepID=A0A9Q0GPB2_9MAGN|nr:hypothetical protein NE237_026822 [Protea cynaroides]